MGGIAQFSTVGQTVHLPPALVQPIAADDVATALAEVTLGTPVNGMIEIAGPERAGLDELVGRFMGATKDPREVITDVDARYYGLVINDQSLTPGANPRTARLFSKTGSNVPRARQACRLEPRRHYQGSRGVERLISKPMLPCASRNRLRLISSSWMET